MRSSVTIPPVTFRHPVSGKRCRVYCTQCSTWLTKHDELQQHEKHWPNWYPVDKDPIDIDTCPRIKLTDGTEARYFPAPDREPEMPWVILNGNITHRAKFPFRAWFHQELSSEDHRRITEAMVAYDQMRASLNSATTVQGRLVAYIAALKATRVRVVFAWYDLWIGVFVDLRQRQVYVFPIPMVGLRIEWAR